MTRKERPILFNAPMVTAILHGTKTQARRLLKPQPRVPGNVTEAPHAPFRDIHCPYGVPGDHLWVREAWRTPPIWDAHPPSTLPKDPSLLGIWYDADGEPPSAAGKGRPSIHMPRHVSRIVLQITRVRVERLQDMRESDALAEGFAHESLPGYPLAPSSASACYHKAWQALHGLEAWQANPWVWVLEFRRIAP